MRNRSQTIQQQDHLTKHTTDQMLLVWNNPEYYLAQLFKANDVVS